MDDNTTRQLVSLLASSIQDFCHGQLKFSSSVEVVGHIHLNIDRSIKLDYVLSEEVNKITNGSSFQSHSYLSKPPDSVSEPGGLIGPRDSDSHQDNANTNRTSESPTVNSLAVVPSPLVTPSNGSTNVAISSTETALISQPLNISVSLGCSALPIVKQENVTLPEVHTSETDWSVNRGEIDSHQSSSFSRDNGQSVPTYMHEHVQVPYEINIQPGVLERSTQELSQSVVTSQLIHQTTEIQIPETPQPIVICHNLQESQSAGSGLSVQRNHHINVRPESSPSVNIIERQPPGVDYSQTNCQSAVGQSVLGVSSNISHEEASSSDSFHSQVAANLPQMNFGALGMIQVKQEYIDEPSNVTDPFSSCREIEMEIPEYGNVVIESLGQQMDGTQLMVMREGIQQQESRTQQPFPFPIMLHSHSAMSVHNSSHPGTSASMMPATPAAVSLPDSSSVLHPNSSSNTDVSSKEAKARKRSNNCKTRKRAVVKKRLLETMHTFQSESAVKKAKAEKKTTRPDAIKSSTLPAAAAAKVHRRKPSNQQLGTVKNISSNKSQRNKKQKNTQSVNKNNKRRSQTRKSKQREDTRARKSSEDSKSKTPRLGGPVHALTKIPWIGQSHPPRKRCFMCKKRGQDVFCTFACFKCPNQPGFCRIRSCFSSCHSKMGVKYSE